jgi:hypothetical protein
MRRADDVLKLMNLFDDVVVVVELMEGKMEANGVRREEKEISVVEDCV